MDAETNGVGGRAALELEAFNTLTDFVERVTHWQEGGADRHSAKLALKTLAQLPQFAEASTRNKEAGAQEWRCFHCDAVFHDAESAAEHFGRSENQQPGCQIDLAEYRRMEEVNRRHCDEDTELHRAVYAAQAEGEEKARRAEDAGYARGLADAKKHPEELGLTFAVTLEAGERNV